MYSSLTQAQVSRNFNKTQKPKYEIGGGFAYFNMPNYPGSKGSRLRFIPFPIVIYRGNTLRADEDGTRARIIKDEAFEFGFSGGFNFPITKEDNEIRKGMEDTGALIGFGPALIFNLLKTETKKLISGIGLRVNYEAKSTSDINNQGWIIEPYLRYLYKPSAESQFTFLSSINISYADEKYNSFFYGVESYEATHTRSEFKAKEGLVDITTFLGLTYDTKKSLSLFVGGLYSNLAVSRNRESDLLEKKHNFGIGIGLTWLFIQSDQLVK
jgi:outer membrane scaffolding protein for murein synthesis (MipA/OmpV family)